jgi:FkbM family methyltransferase
MTFVSYAQNFEDVMLWRALRDVTEGFYIDVGANDPTLYSITKAFHMRGWRGINIEPVRSDFRKFQMERPHDVNLCVAAGTGPGLITLHEVVKTSLSTTATAVADLHQQNGYVITTSLVEVLALNDICAQFVKGQIHFVKIDVEGSEKDVLAGFDLMIWRPWVLVVEALAPLSQTENYHEWEPGVLSANYVFAYADGLNRFYVAEERSGQLLQAFRYPPNVFDDFVQNANQEGFLRAREADASAAQSHEALVHEAARTGQAEQRAERVGRRADLTAQRVEGERLRTNLVEQRADIAEGQVILAEELEKRFQTQLDDEIARSTVLADRLADRENQLVATYRSRSWRLTAPLRSFTYAVQRRGRRLAAAPLPTVGGMDQGPEQPTIFIECTHTFHSELNTGIQRVVRNVLRNAEVVASGYGYAVVPVLIEGDRLLGADISVVLSNKLLNRAQAASLTVAPIARHEATIERLWRRMRKALRPAWRGSLRVASGLLPFAPVRRFLYAPTDQRGLSRCILLSLRALRLQRKPAISPTSPPFDLDHRLSCTADILLLLDSSWTVPLWPAVRRFKRRGGRVVGVIYDIVPISHPYTSMPNLVEAFTKWLHNHAQYTDSFIAISQSVARQLGDYLNSRGEHGEPLTHAPISYFHLGSELDFAADMNEVREHVGGIFARQEHLFLVVGSIEPRKNHMFVLDAFDRLWDAGVHASLVIIGRHGWKTEDFFDRVARHRELGQRLFFLRDATDSELDYAYRNSSALVIASTIEGFGLPIVEAFQRGLPVLCSDIPVFREIAEGRAVFFDLDDPSRLTSALLSYCHAYDPARRPTITPQSWLSWRESTEQLIAAVLRDEVDGAGAGASSRQLASTARDQCMHDHRGSDVNGVNT